MNHFRRLGLSISLFICGLVAPSLVFAQWGPPGGGGGPGFGGPGFGGPGFGGPGFGGPGFGGPGFGGPGFGGPGFGGSGGWGGRDHGEGGGRFGGDPKERLKRFDANGNGILEPDEVPGPVKGFLEARYNVKLDHPMSIDEIVAKGQAGPGGQPTPGSDADKNRNSSGSTKPPLVPGFGISSDLPLPPGFDVPLKATSASFKPLRQRYSASVIESVESMLKQYDKNGNGYLDADEWKDVQWRGDPRESDLDKDGRLSKEELCERFSKSRDREKRDSQRGGRSHDEQDAGGGGGGSPSASASSSSSSDRIRSYAESLMKQYDENKNGKLEREEWSRMKGSWEEADRNKDGVITMEELLGQLSKFSGGEGRGPGGPGRSRSGGGSRSRSLSPTERLPEGLPSWFARSDADGDGQVSLAEYCPTFDVKKAAEFARYDLNGDGFVTPEECLAVEKSGGTGEREGKGDRGDRGGRGDRESRR